MKVTQLKIDNADTKLFVCTEEGWRTYYSERELRRLIDAACVENDTRVGKLQRELEMERDTNYKRRMWLREQKKKAGVNDDVSFDDVWKEALLALIYCKRNKIEYRKIEV